MRKMWRWLRHHLFYGPRWSLPPCQRPRAGPCFNHRPEHDSATLAEPDPGTPLGWNVYVQYGGEPGRPATMEPELLGFVPRGTGPGQALTPGTAANVASSWIRERQQAG